VKISLGSLMVEERRPLTLRRDEPREETFRRPGLVARMERFVDFRPLDFFIIKPP